MKILGYCAAALLTAAGGFSYVTHGGSPIFQHSAGFNPEPSWTLPTALRDSAARSRLTVVFAPARPGCGSVLIPALETLRRFGTDYPETRMLTALRPELRLPKEYLLGASFPLDANSTVGFGGQEAGVVAAFDRAGRTLLFRVFTRASVDHLYDELEAAYSLTAPNDIHWAALDAKR